MRVLSRFLPALAAVLVAAVLLCGPGKAQMLSPNPIQHFVDNNGNPLSGGKLFTYQAGTTTKLATYNSSNGGTPNTNPVILNTRGEAPIWLSPSGPYKFVLSPGTDSDPPTNPIWTVDNIFATPSAIGPMSGTLPTIFPDTTTSPYVILAVTSDTATPVTATSTLTVDHFFGGSTNPNNYCSSTNQCSHFGIWSFLKKTAATPGLSFDTGIFSNYQITATGSKDPVTGFFLQANNAYSAQLADNAGQYNADTGMEVDVALTGALPVNIKEGMAVVSAPLQYGNDSNHGTVQDSAYDAYASSICGSASSPPIGAGTGAGGSNCAGFNLGFSLGRYGSYFPVSPGGTIMGVPAGILGIPTALFGIDLLGVTFQANNDLTQGTAFRSRGFFVDGAGTLFLGRPFPAIQFTDSNISGPPWTSGQKQRLAGLGNGHYAWQINTGADGSYGTLLTVFDISATGFVKFPLAVTAAAGVTVGPPVPGPGMGSNPPLNNYSFYVDPADNKLKALASTGVITILASP